MLVVMMPVLMVLMVVPLMLMIAAALPAMLVIVMMMSATLDVYKRQGQWFLCPLPAPSGTTSRPQALQVNASLQGRCV